MIIRLDMSPQERYLVYSALMGSEERLKDEPGYNELVARVAALPCGSPGCDYCDPQNYGDYE